MRDGFILHFICLVPSCATRLGRRESGQAACHDRLTNPHYMSDCSGLYQPLTACSAARLIESHRAGLQRERSLDVTTYA